MVMITISPLNPPNTISFTGGVYPKPNLPTRYHKTDSPIPGRSFRHPQESYTDKGYQGSWTLSNALNGVPKPTGHKATFNILSQS